MQPAHQGVLQVEPTDHCNLACRMCAPHFERWQTVHGVPKGYLDPALWARIVDGLVADDVRFDHVIFQWLGDPSLHPKLAELVGYAARHLAGRVGYLRIDTNGVLLDPERIDRLLAELHAAQTAAKEEVPLLVVFTLDAASAPTYAYVKGRDHFDRVRRHIRHLVRRRRATGVRVNLQLQFVVQEGNAHEAHAFLHYWSDLLACQGGSPWHDEILFKRLSVRGGALGQGAADALYERTVADIAPGPHGAVHVVTWERRPWERDDAHAGPRGPCPGLWLTPVIRHDGQLVMCCADLHSELALGSLRAHSFRELWEGEKATRKRLAHLAGRFEGPCAGCGGIHWYDTTAEMMRETRRRAAELGIALSGVHDQR